MMDAEDRRTADRTATAGRVMIVHGEDACFVELLDASEGGCALRVPVDIPLDVENVVRLFFYAGDGAPPLIVPARVARIDGEGIGIEYHEPQAVPPLFAPAPAVAGP